MKIKYVTIFPDKYIHLLSLQSLFVAVWRQYLIDNNDFRITSKDPHLIPLPVVSRYFSLYFMIDILRLLYTFFFSDLYKKTHIQSIYNVTGRKLNHC